MSMELQAILLLLGVLLLVAAFVSRPFVQTARRLAANDRTRSALLAERERLLTALRELDFDYSLGKIPEEDYPAQRAELIRNGAEVIRKLDELPAVVSPAPIIHSEKHVSLTDDDVEDLIAKRRSGRKEKAGGFCPNCGKAVLVSDRFCPSCGKILK
jgi:hypothetical protein